MTIDETAGLDMLPEDESTLIDQRWTPSPIRIQYERATEVEKILETERCATHTSYSQGE